MGINENTADNGVVGEKCREDGQNTDDRRGQPKETTKVDDREGRARDGVGPRGGDKNTGDTWVRDGRVNVNGRWRKK